MLLSAAAGAIVGAFLMVAQSSSWLTGTTDDRFNTLANIQPGLGTVMIEYANRLGNVYYAAQVGNWGMAAYQLKEAGEIQEVGETTRPARKPLLVFFEQTYLKPLAQDIVNMDINAFNADFGKAVTGCNTCHTGTGFGYIQYMLPDKPAMPVSMAGGQTFNSADLQALLVNILGS
jgi:hypothetical protein